MRTTYSKVHVKIYLPSTQRQDPTFTSVVTIAAKDFLTCQCPSLGPVRPYKPSFVSLQAFFLPRHLVSFHLLEK